LSYGRTAPVRADVEHTRTTAAGEISAGLWVT